MVQGVVPSHVEDDIPSHVQEEVLSYVDEEVSELVSTFDEDVSTNNEQGSLKKKLKKVKSLKKEKRLPVCEKGINITINMEERNRKDVYSGQKDCL